ncbi:MAG: tRNA uridine-5-carboxymethylaminomethyl(34) synthesis GTPase MnmE, partial [Oscillospiraceae bacterium]|nr:tRNA uridine-5-carboxymethylaminomethyl(34) synthesis GTPase MnmE [Oscillospiraceae bacterium]
ARAVFTPAAGGRLEEQSPRKLVYGVLTDKQGRPIDQILATWSPGPHSYTGEDTAELQCHGSPAVLALGLEALFAAGARQALPGEFTRRAFLNGRMDLAQSEAVIDLIDAQTGEAARNAYGQLAGALSRRVEGVYSGLADVLAHFHAVLDYPDEDLDPFTAQEVEQSLSQALAGLEALLRTYERGGMLTEGVPCAIVGRPNVGKSSLLNALLGYERAIVTPVPGTTRDTLEERLRLGGVLLRLVDTAGLRSSDDPVERLGVQRSRAAIESARLVLAVLDGSQPLSDEDRAALKAAEQAPACICVVNNADLPPALDLGELAGRQVCVLSAKTGQGLEELENAVAACFPQGEEPAGSLLTNARQAEAAARAKEHLLAAQAGLAAGVTPDALLTDVEQAMDCLGQLTGRSVREDVTERIFSRFCVGK